MLARRLPGILPPLSTAEALEVTRIHSVAGLLAADRPLITARPLRSPHGGGSVGSADARVLMISSTSMPE